MIKTNTDTCSSKELADIALSNNLYVSSTWLLKRTLEKISNGDRSESKAKLWIAYRASKPVGVAVLSGKDSSLMFYVKAEHRRQGIAS
ncbi:MAG: GNAT family N-acetyltransferase, partial [Prevotella sp.]